MLSIIRNGKECLKHCNFDLLLHLVCYLEIDKIKCSVSIYVELTEQNHMKWYLLFIIQVNDCLVLLLTVKKGDRVAQLVCEKICYPDLVEEEVNFNPASLICTSDFWVFPVDLDSYQRRAGIKNMRNIQSV